jgi:cytochrome c-type biogenesis protein
MTRISLVIALAVLALMAVGCVGGEPDLSSGLGVIVDCDDNPHQSLEAGYKTPDFRFRDAAGDTFSLSHYRGRMVMLNFWSTGCDLCLGEIPYLEQVYEEWPEEDLAVLTIVLFEEADIVSNFLEDSGIALPVILDEEGKAMVPYCVDETPRTFFIDKEGWIRGIKYGNLDSLEEVEDILQQVIVLQEGG